MLYQWRLCGWFLCPEGGKPRRTHIPAFDVLRGQLDALVRTLIFASIWGGSMNSGTVSVTAYRKKKAIKSMIIVIPSDKNPGNGLQQQCCLTIQSHKQTFVYDGLLYLIKNIHISDYNDVYRLAQLRSKKEPVGAIGHKRRKRTGRRTAKQHSVGIKSSWNCGGCAPTCFMGGGGFTPR